MNLKSKVRSTTILTSFYEIYFIQAVISVNAGFNSSACKKITLNRSKISLALHESPLLFILPLIACYCVHLRSKCHPWHRFDPSSQFFSKNHMQYHFLLVSLYRYLAAIKNCHFFPLMTQWSFFYIKQSQMLLCMEFLMHSQIFLIFFIQNGMFYYTSHCVDGPRSLLCFKKKVCCMSEFLFSFILLHALF